MTDYIDGESWIDMTVGETGTAFGALDQIGVTNAGVTIGQHLVLRFSEGRPLLINCADGSLDHLNDDSETRRNWLGAHILVRVRRTERGVEGLAAWEPGGVPVPLGPTL